MKDSCFKNRGSAGERLIFSNFLGIFSYDLSISLAQNISLLDKSRQFVSSVKADYKNKQKKTNAFNSINSILYRYMGVIIDREKRYALR